MNPYQSTRIGPQQPCQNAVSEHGTDASEYYQAPTPRGIPSKFSDTLLSVASTTSFQDKSWSRHHAYQHDMRERIRDTSYFQSAKNIRTQSADKVDDLNDIWRKFVFGSDGPESDAGATSHAVTLHNGEHTPSPKSIEGQCSAPSEDSSILRFKSSSMPATTTRSQVDNRPLA